MKHESREFSTNEDTFTLLNVQTPITGPKDIDWSKSADEIFCDYAWNIEAFDACFDSIKDPTLIVTLIDMLDPDIEFVYDHREGIYNCIPYRILLLNFPDNFDDIFGEFYKEDCRKYGLITKDMNEDQLIDYLKTLSYYDLIKCCSCVKRKFSSTFFDNLLKIREFQPEVIASLRLNDSISCQAILPHIKKLLKNYSEGADDFYAYLMSCIFPKDNKKYDDGEIDLFLKSMGKIDPYYMYKYYPSLLTPNFVYSSFDVVAEDIISDKDDTSIEYIKEMCEDYPVLLQLVGSTIHRILSK